MHLLRRQPRLCKAGLQWYTCDTNKFKGCCSVDPCDLRSCPDSQSSSAGVKPTKTVTLEIQGPKTTALSRASILVVKTSTLSEPSSTPTIAASSLSSTIQSSVSTSSSASQVAAATSLPSVSPDVPPAPSSGSGRSNTPIIAGSVAGFVFMVVAAILIWFCIRRRRQKQEPRSSSTQPLRQSPGPYASEAQRVEGQHLKPDDVFAPFGGYHKELPASDHGPSNKSSQQTLHVTSLSRANEEDIEDAPLPGVEKGAFNPPPMMDHPALHPRPGESPDVPAYLPGNPTAASELNPAYLAKHPSLLGEHPALRSNKSRSLSPPPSSSNSHLAHQLSATGSTVKKMPKSHLSLSTLPSHADFQKPSLFRTTAIHSATNPPYQPSCPPMRPQPAVSQPTTLFRPQSLQELESCPRTMTHHSSLPSISADIPPPNAGTSELPAVVPAELRGDDKNLPPIVSRQLSTNTTGTQASTYSIPIGLGVDTTSTPIQYYSPLEPVLERGSVSETSGTPGFAPYGMVSPPLPESASTPNSTGFASPEFQPSPRSAFGTTPDLRSDLRSPSYQFYTVSPPAPPTPAFRPFEQFPSSLQIGGRSSLSTALTRAQTSKDTNFTPQVFQPRSSLPQSTKSNRPLISKINTSTSSSQPLQEPTYLYDQETKSRPSKDKVKDKSTLGKGKEHAMAWATYGSNSNNTTPPHSRPTTSTQTPSPTPSSSRNSPVREVEVEQHNPIPLNTEHQEPSQLLHTPAYPPNTPRNSTRPRQHRHEERTEAETERREQERWSGSTATMSMMQQPNRSSMLEKEQDGGS